jgi:[acyl-carrier-protein] S-malonyltransferase
VYSFVFPGQGMQQAGMLADIIECYPGIRQTLMQFSDLCGHDMIELHRHASIETLTDAKLSGLIVVAGSIALADFLKSQGVAPAAVAGYSVGQYAALYAANVLDMPALVDLLLCRQECLDQAAKRVPSVMISVIGVPLEKIEQLQQRHEALYITNYNCPNHMTLACSKAAQGDILNALQELSPIKVTLLPVAGGWHSPFVEPSAAPLKEKLASASLNDPSCLFLDNVTGQVESDSETIRQNLYAHLFRPVLWQQSIKALAATNSDPFIEVGYGDQLSKFIKFTNRRAQIHRTGTAAELQQFIQGVAA